VSDVAIPFAGGTSIPAPDEPPTNYAIADVVDLLTAPPRGDSLRIGIARELHDQLAQGLTTMLIRIERLKRSKPGDRALTQELADLQESLREILVDVRGLLNELRGTGEGQDDLVDTIRERLGPRFERQFGVQVRVRVTRDWPSRLAAMVSQNLLRIVQEAMTNAILHGGAGVIRVELKSYPKDRLGVVVSDDGSWPDGVEPFPEGHGILGMRERTKLLGGDLMILRSERGTTVRAVIPRPRVA
jgi:signal transduction histidine kinase